MKEKSLLIFLVKLVIVTIAVAVTEWGYARFIMPNVINNSGRRIWFTLVLGGFLISLLGLIYSRLFTGLLGGKPNSILGVSFLATLLVGILYLIINMFSKQTLFTNIRYGEETDWFLILLLAGVTILWQMLQGVTYKILFLKSN